MLAAKWLEKNMTDVHSVRWIPTGEALPDSERPVLIWLHERGYYMVGRFVKKRNCWAEVGRSKLLAKRWVSHWMEVQKPGL